MHGQDEAAFTRFVERHARFVFRVAYAVLRNSHDAEDAMQETFLKLYRNGGWRGADDERAFLARAAWRMAVDRLPRREAPVDENFDLPSSSPGPEQLSIAADWQGRVHALVDALPEELRQPLALSAIDGLSSREIGLALGIPEGTVRTRILRARQMLREKLSAMEGQGHARRKN